mmetsp:Transcript_49352/g.57691  ORF Transcript_49352/g.57691 Transcript_49352/m.57691 type:complete len:243 (-) Transcript_49352:231-959(-)
MLKASFRFILLLFSPEICRKAHAFHRSPLFETSQISHEHNAFARLLSPLCCVSDGNSSPSSDWTEAELTLKVFPTEPSPEMSPEFVAISCCRSLQFVDHPTESAGLERCFPFFAWECRNVVTARKGGDTVERFCKYGVLSPALQPFMGAKKIDLGEGTLNPGTMTRGDLVSFPVTVYGNDALSFQHPSGLIRDTIDSTPKESNFVIRMEKARRPPLQGCWLVKEVLDVRFAFAGDMGNDIGE